LKTTSGRLLTARSRSYRSTCGQVRPGRGALSDFPSSVSGLPASSVPPTGASPPRHPMSSTVDPHRQHPLPLHRCRRRRPVRLRSIHSVGGRCRICSAEIGGRRSRKGRRWLQREVTGLLMVVVLLAVGLQPLLVVVLRPAADPHPRHCRPPDLSGVAQAASSSHSGAARRSEHPCDGQMRVSAAGHRGLLSSAASR
jgi:hypothetical protein